MNRLENKVVVITGGNSGVGAATAKLFAQEGATVVISARRKEALDSVAKEIEEMGGKVLAVPTDVSKPEQCVNLIETAVNTFGKIDVLVNNAGVLDTGLKAIDKFLDEDLDKVVNINQKGAMYCMRAALKYMIPQKAGSIVNVASVAGYTGGGGAAYVSSKAAVIGITKHAAMRLASSKIRCNVICPGNILTPMTANIDYSSMDMEMFGAMAAHADLKGCGSCTAEDVANVLLFFASDESKPLTGQAIVCDFGADL